MAKQPNQKLKILYLLKILQEKTDDTHGIGMPAILKELNEYGVPAERKSIYDDIGYLGDYGIEIDQYKDGNKTLYALSQRKFELSELKLLVDAVQSSKFITEKKSHELIAKIESLASVYEAKELNRQVYVADRVKAENESIFYGVDAIHAAISANKKIEFRYMEWDTNKKLVPKHDGKIYKLSPVALVWDDENYYLIAYDHETEIIKHFRVDKIKDAKVSEEPGNGYQVRQKLDLGQYSSKTFGMFGGNDEMVTLRVKNHMAGIIIDRFGQKPVFRKVKGEDCFDVTVKVSVSNLFLSWIMAFGGDIKIISPDSVVDKFKALAQKAADIYK